MQTQASRSRHSPRRSRVPHFRVCRFGLRERAGGKRTHGLKSVWPSQYLIFTQAARKDVIEHGRHDFLLKSEEKTAVRCRGGEITARGNVYKGHPYKGLVSKEARGKTHPSRERNFRTDTAHRESTKREIRTEETGLENAFERRHGRLWRATPGPSSEEMRQIRADLEESKVPWPERKGRRGRRGGMGT